MLEDSTAAWQKAADATVADDLYWRLSATVPAGLTAYDTYTVRFVDTMSAGLDPSKVAASMHVYVAAGADGGFDAVSTGRDGAPAPSPRRAGPTSRPSAPPRWRPAVRPSPCAPAT